MDSAEARPSVEDVVITGELDRRPSRTPDHQAEALALASLGDAMSSDPGSVLQRLVEAARELTHADSAGVSLPEAGGEQGAFRWHATAGAWAPYRDGVMPREQSPCGKVVARNTVLLVKNPERAFPALLQAEPGIGEGLLAPFEVDGEAAGTLWVIKHEPDGRFDAEDARVVKGLARFASAAHQMVRALETVGAKGRQAEERYLALFNAIEQGFCTIELAFDAEDRPIDYRFLEVSPSFERQTGVCDAAGRWMREIAPEQDQHWFDIYGRVAVTGEPARFENYSTPFGRWWSVYAFRISGPHRVAVLFHDITDSKRAEAALRINEERQTFLLQLSDTLRPLGDPEAIRLTAAQMLGRHLRASRVAYAEDVGDGQTFFVTENFVDGAMQVVGPQRYADFGPDILEGLRAGRNRVQPNIPADDRLNEREKRALAEAQVGASLNIPLVKDGRLIAFLGVNYAEAHEFEPDEIRLVSEVAERTWAAIERARAEVARTEIEQRFRGIVEAVDSVFYITALDRRRLLYLSPYYERIWGRPSADLLEDLSRFADTIYPDDRDVVAAAIGRQSRGESVESEYRIVRPDGATRWIADRSFPMAGASGRLSAGLATDITDRKRAEAALTDSEERLRQFGEASQDVLWIRDAETSQWEYSLRPSRRSTGWTARRRSAATTWPAGRSWSFPRTGTTRSTSSAGSATGNG